jgi:hypothetical protein
MRCRQSKLLHLKHRFPPRLNEDTPRSPLEPLVRRNADANYRARRAILRRCNMRHSNFAATANPSAYQGRYVRRSHLPVPRLVRVNI